MAPCPVCKKVLSSISVHLSTVHRVENTEEKKILIQLANQKVSILTSPCPVPGCGYQRSRLDRHLTNGHTDLSDQEKQRHIETAQRSKAITLLRGLRASSPNVPMATSLDLAAAEEASTPDYVQVLESAKPGVLDISQRLRTGQQLEESQQTLFRYFCEAILLKEHQLTESAVQNFKVEHWVARTPSNSGIFIDHFDISLTPKQEEWLEIYFTHVRSWSVKKSSNDVHDKSMFFLSQKGAPLLNLRLDMKRLWELFPQVSETDLPAVSSRSQQRSVAVSEEGDDQQPSCSYAVGHSQTSKRDRSPPSSSSSDGDTEEASVSRSASQRKRNAKSTWLSFLDLFPVTVHATMPTQEDIVSAGFHCESRRYLFNKWRATQREQRIQYILDKSKFRNCPTEARVASLLSAEQWAVNCPSAIDVVQSWVPVKDHSKCPDIVNRIQAQSWKGLCLKDFGPPKNKGCGEKVCIDAQNFPCRCHPHQDTFGRRMNHSRKGPNVKPRILKLPFPEGTRW